MTLSDLSIKNPVFAWMIMLGLIVFGTFSFFQMGISQLPDVDFPEISVRVTLEGASPEVVETQLTDVIEDAVMSIEGVKEISSTSRQGQASVTIEFDLERDIDLALQEVQSKISQAQRDLPQDIDPPVITKTNPEDQPIMWIALSGEGVPLKELMDYTHDVLEDKFTTVPGVGEINLGGYVDPNLRVWVNNAKLNALELTSADVVNAINKEHQEIPAGYIETEQTETNVRVMGEANSVEEFQKIIIPQRSGQPIWKPIRLSDVATVEDGLDDVRRISRHMDIPAVGLGIKKQRGSNAVAVAQDVKAKVEELQSTLPPNYKLTPVFDLTKFIEEATFELNFTLILSAILTGIVCWLFLGSWSSTFNVLLAIPTSIIGSFTILYFMGFTLNTFTLLGLALAIGIVVDDAIMVLENIVRHRENGLSRVQAAIVGAREITFAALAASIAILAIFVPVIFMKGIMGLFFFQFGITMSAAVLLSLVEALTMAPMRCSQYLKVGHNNPFSKKVDEWMDRFNGFYTRTLHSALEHRWKVILGSTLLFGVSLYASKFIHQEFVPSQDQGRLMVRVQTPLGSSLHFTDNVMKQAESIVKKMPSVLQYYVAVGGFGGGETNAAMMFVTLKPLKERPVTKGWKHESHHEVMASLRKELGQIPGIVRAIVQDPSLSGFSSKRGYPVEFTLRGPDWDNLGKHSETLMAAMAKTGLMQDIDTDYQLGMPEVQIVPDRQKAAERGVSISAIGTAVNTLVGGQRVGKYTRDGKRYDIRMKLVAEDRDAISDIQNVWVRNNFGELVSLKDVVTLEEKSTLLSISRRDRERAIGITANVTQGQSQAAALEEVRKIAKQTLPSEYRVVFSGSTETFEESKNSLIFAMLLGVFVAYMILASQFNSFIHPFIVLLAMPFSLTGAFAALLAGGESLNIYSMIGVILLMGIVKKNSILLVDFTNERRRSGSKTDQALMEACPTRLRPIMMTSIATIAGAIPLAMGIGPGAETRVPMALVILGGVSVSTFLTLYVVPCAYSLMSRLENHQHDQDLKEALKELNSLQSH